MSLRKNMPIDERPYFISRHCILRNPFKIRVVFDASTRVGNVMCLNASLHIGPKLQNNLVKIYYVFDYTYCFYF